MSGPFLLTSPPHVLSDYFLPPGGPGTPDYYQVASRNQVGGLTGAPASRHSYALLAVGTRLGNPILFCTGGGITSASGFGSTSTWIFDLTQSYSTAMSTGGMGWIRGTDVPSNVGTATVLTGANVWDAIGARFVHFSRRFFGAYYPDTDTWESWPTNNVGNPADSQMGITIDPVGRKAYVSGITFGTHTAVIDLVAKSINFVGAWGANLGDAMGWNSSTNELVTWYGSGNNLAAIDPSTGLSRTLYMGGTSVTNAESSGTYGRFQVLSGGRVILLNSTNDGHIFGGTLFPLRTWVTRANSGGTNGESGFGYMYLTGGKHGQAAYRPSGNAITYAASGVMSPTNPQQHTALPSGLLLMDGDQIGTQLPGSGSYRAPELWHYDVLRDQFKLVRPTSVDGAIQPNRGCIQRYALCLNTDELYIGPPFQDDLSASPMPVGTPLSAIGGYVYTISTGLFRGPNVDFPPPPFGDSNSGWGADGGTCFEHMVWDPQTDDFICLGHGGVIQRMDRTSKTWRTYTIAGCSGLTGRSPLVLDNIGRAFYFLDVFGSLAGGVGPPSLVKVNLDTDVATKIALPSGWVQVPADHLPLLSFDPGNRVILAPNNPDMGFTPIAKMFIYNVDTASTVFENVPSTVWGTTMGFDESTGRLALFGKKLDNFPSQTTGIFLYQYGAGQSSFTPTPDMGSLIPSTCTPGSATFTLTVSGTNIQSTNIITWNGSPRTTSPINSFQVSASIPASDVVAEGGNTVHLISPDSDNSLQFVVSWGLATLDLTFLGKLYDQVGPGAAFSMVPNGQLDGTFAVTLHGGGHGRTITSVILKTFDSQGVNIGEWTTVQDGTHWVCGVSSTLGGALLNNPTTGAVNFFLADGGTIYLYAEDLNNTEFLNGNTCTVTITFSDTRTAIGSGTTNLALSTLGLTFLPYGLGVF